MSPASLIRRLFALPPRALPRRPVIPFAILRSATPGPGEIALVTGASGGGKSRLLAALRDAHEDDPSVTWIDPTDIRLSDNACVIERVCEEIGLRDDGPAPIELALALLSRVGLAEAWTYLQMPSTLSDGQRWRLILALAIARAWRIADQVDGHSVITAIIAMDEFAALLDRITARIVSRALRRLIDNPIAIDPATASEDGIPPRARPRVSAIVVTSHDDLQLALDPDVIVTCDFGCFGSTRPERQPSAQPSRPATRRDRCCDLNR